MITERENQIIDLLLQHEHKNVAAQLQFIKQKPQEISQDLLNKSITLIDRLSRFSDEVSKRISITLCAILWTYREQQWTGLKDFLILVLSRMGFSPTALMIDEEYDNVANRYSPMSSLINQFTITCYHLKYEVVVKDKTFLLTEFQKNIWEKIEGCSLLGISAPTSAGKSFVILLKCIDMLIKNHGNGVYIVPTLSLVFQVSVDFRKLLDQFGLNDYEILTTFYDKDENDKTIYILTQEKAIAAFSQQDHPFNNLRFLIIDEIQNVERVGDEDEQRAKTLYDSLIEFRHTCKPEKTIISGPRIESIGELGTTIFGSQSEEEQTKGSPVVNFTYAISKVGNSYYFKQYTDIKRVPSSLRITNPSAIDGHGKVQYRKGFHGYLSHIIKHLGPTSYNIIFSPTSNQARKTAMALSEMFNENTSDLTSLIDYVSTTVHPKYDLCYTLSRGIAYHHGKTPPHIRRAVEKAIRDKIVKNVVCTTTLMQGVNLPAQTVIIRNPYLYVSSRYGYPKLTNYEIANLRGRAGRLLKDFIGRTYVLDENSFEDTVEQKELFTESKKELHPGYGEKFLANKEEVIEDLIQSNPPSESNLEYSFLLTYIRQVALKYKNDGLSRLKTVGINISAGDYNLIVKMMQSLEVPREICFKNRYWDPLDLNRLFQQCKDLVLPISISNSNVTGKLMKLIGFMMTEFPIYSKRYFEIDNEPLLKSCCISAEHWLKEWPLKRILSNGYYDSSDKIEREISLLQNGISFGLPMLLKPIYDIKNEEAMFLRFIELGAYNPFTRRMIELNVPRETAINLTERYFNDKDYHESNVDLYIKSKLRKILPELNYWDKIQLESLI